MNKKIMCVAGARPNFMKIGPIVQALRAVAGVEPYLVHTGQHYDAKMSQLFFEELAIPEPDVNLGIGSGSHTVQTAQTMIAFEQACLRESPDMVLVVGDVNGTLACGLVAAKLSIPLVHVEAGLRSFDRTMPEEINRILTDAISDLLFVSEPSGLENLKNEGIASDKVHFVGNVMIDSLLGNLVKSEASAILDQLDVEPKGYAVLTLHRPSNVDDSDAMTRILDAIDVIQARIPVVFPMHPRTRRNVADMGLEGRIAQMPNLIVIDPVGYLDFLKLNANASLVLTDSGGIQEETTVLQVPCITLRENTERPITIDVGTNRLVGSSTDAIITAFQQLSEQTGGTGRIPELWDGKTANRIADIIARSFEEQPRQE